MENRPIVATWGTGPSYRKRIIKNITDTINIGYDNIMDYIILTDYPEDFYELRDKTKKIIEIVNIHDARKISPWSENTEFIPKSIDEYNYGKEYYEINYRNRKLFSYALNRFSLPKISELGYNKFVLADCDVNIRYDKIISGEVTENEFWDQYNTPVNTMKGVDLQKFDIRSANASEIDLPPNMRLLTDMEMCSILKYKLGEKYRDEYHKSGGPFTTDYTQTEGPFRYYHLTSPQMVRKYFDMWDEAMKILLEDRFLSLCTVAGGYMYVDYIPFSMVNHMLNIKPIRFENKWFTVNIFFQDRYFMPRGTGFGNGMDFKPAETYEKFFEKNKELIDWLKSRNQFIE